MTAHMVARLGTLPSWLPNGWFDDGFVQPIMRAPVFKRPMYEALDSYDREWLIPGLGNMKQTDLVTVLETNPQFIETFLLGLSDEMGRELLWRGYPTDSRGTYFKRFWMPGYGTSLAQQITSSATRRWARISARRPAGLWIDRSIGTRRVDPPLPACHHAGAATDGQGCKRQPPFCRAAEGQAPGGILFQVPLQPDILITGFNLSERQLTDAARDNLPWWFLISEHPTAPRFGLDLAVGDPDVPARSNVDRDSARW